MHVTAGGSREGFGAVAPVRLKAPSPVGSNRSVRIRPPSNPAASSSSAAASTNPLEPQTKATSGRLGELLDELVFVGGATVELWITDPTAPEFRPT